MQFISCHDGKLQTLETAGLKTASGRAFTTGLTAWDALAPGQSFARGAVHELLFDPHHGQPKFAAALMANSAADVSSPSLGTPGEGWGEGSHGGRIPSNDRPLRRTLTLPSPGVPGEGKIRPVIWSDPNGEVYPPALAALGLDLSRTYLLRTTSDADEAWAVAECLRCRGVGAVIAAPAKLSRIEARRLQLAAERGGAIGILLRQTGRGDSIYAAATRWKISPCPGERTVQRWTIQLLHGHGGRVNQTVILEWRREDHSVRAIEQLADRPAAATTATRATA